jgi:translocator protein
MNRKLLVAVNIITTLAVITINILANALPINGLNTGEISDRFDVYFVPAGYVFSIWGLIYLGLIAFSVYQALPSQRDNPHVGRIGFFYALTGIANIVWLFLWHYLQFELTLPAMLLLLVSLTVIFLKLWGGRRQLTRGDRWAILVPFAIYLGWVSVATVANVTQLLAYLNWGGWGISPEVWAFIMLVVAAAIAGLMAWRHASVAYLGVFVWAYIGIAAEHWGAPIVAITAAVLAALIAVGLLISIPRRRRLWGSASA